MIADSNNYPASAPDIDADDDDIDPVAIADALEDVISDIDGFLAHWHQRLAENFAALPSDVKPDELLVRRAEEFEQEKLLWKARRKSEEQGIREKAEQVTEAWLRLEAEQRRFLQIKESHPSSVGNRPAPMDVAVNNAVPVIDATPSPGISDSDRIASEAHSAIESQTPTHRHSIRVNRPRDGAMQQFQQLRREVELSRPGSGKL